MNYKKVRTVFINDKKKVIYAKPKGTREYVKSKGEMVLLSAYLKKVEKMNRVVEILKNIRESRYFDIVETELGRKYDTDNTRFVPFEGDSEFYELVDYNNEEQKEFNRKFFKRVTELEEQEWIELWEIMKGQDYDKFDKEKDFDDQFDGSGLRGWWD